MGDSQLKFLNRNLIQVESSRVHSFRDKDVPWLDFVSFFLLTFIVFGIAYKFKRDFDWGNKRSKWFQDIPGPKALPVIGNGHQMLFKPTEFYKWSWALCKEWGNDMVLMWRLGLPMVFVSSFEVASDLLSRPEFVAKSQDIDMFWRIPGGNGLSSSPAEVHAARRKLLYPGYVHKNIERSIPLFIEESKALLNQLGVFANTRATFEITEVLMPCSFRIICRSAFGEDLMKRKTEEEALEHRRAIHEISKNFTNRLFSPYLWLRNDHIYFHWTQEGKRTKELIDKINLFGLEMISLKRTVRSAQANASNGKDPEMRKSSTDQEEGGPDENLASMSRPSPSPCYLDMLLDFSERGLLSENEILGELNNYIVAAYETTALAIAWTLFALALNPQEHQDRIYDEVREILDGVGDSDKVLTAMDIRRMRYLELCIKEAMRLFPTSPVLPRSTTTNIELKDGRVIPSGTDVMIMVDMIHRDPRYFSNADRFIPERFVHSNKAFLPWGQGVRRCLGQNFAMHQIKVELAYLIKEFIWETEDTESIPKLFQALMIPAEGIRMKVKRR